MRIFGQMIRLETTDAFARNKKEGMIPMSAIKDAFSQPWVNRLGWTLLILSAWRVFAQPDAPPRFDVASVKPNTVTAPRARGVRPLPNGRLTATNASLQMLLINAYGLQPYQLIGGPSWMDSDGFDIEAKGDPSANQGKVLLMLRSLLEDRFQLRFHRESRELPVYALTITKNGPKLPAPKEGGCVTADPNARIPAPAPPGQGPPPVPCGSCPFGKAA